MLSHLPEQSNHVRTRRPDAYEMGERLAKKTAELLDAFLQCEGSVAEAVAETDRAAAHLVHLLEIIPSIDSPYSANVDRLITAVRGFEKDVTEYLIRQADIQAHKDLGL